MFIDSGSGGDRKKHVLDSGLWRGGKARLLTLEALAQGTRKACSSAKNLHEDQESLSSAPEALAGTGKGLFNGSGSGGSGKACSLTQTLAEAGKPAHQLQESIEAESLFDISDSGRDRESLLSDSGSGGGTGKAMLKASPVAACDVDADGFEEVYVLNTDTYGGNTVTSDRLLDDPSDEWTDLFELDLHSNAANFVAGRSCACVDRNGTGRYAVMVANYGGPMRLYEMHPSTGALANVAGQANVAETTGGRALVSGLIVSSVPGMDIYANNEWSQYSGDLKGSNFLYKNNGDGTYEEVAEELGLKDEDNNGRGTALMDANGDGLVDVVYGNWNGNHRLFIQNADGTFSDQAPLDMSEPSRIRTVIPADFDNDGK
ncbi:hypothetical protein CYMTET_13386 [Cymbomonas tetramitiformis]|uniref:Uncharacterized protein n=1 Tax=Cymbomonas tetramitiformis TaxID=36881 RepID=A0AAE0GII1_9CHLO|nr:hypothetical protein CYMTET_13386 [Cymbomonas tetramitiformis]